MTLENAQQLVVRKINENSQYKMVVKEVKEKPDGWVFYYDSEEAVKTGDWQTTGFRGTSPYSLAKMELLDTFPIRVTLFSMNDPGEGFESDCGNGDKIWVRGWRCGSISIMQIRQAL